ncbi:hypothetical protein P3S67_030799 [Capsicum chacoense]
MLSKQICQRSIPLFTKAELCRPPIYSFPFPQLKISVADSPQNSQNTKNLQFSISVFDPFTLFLPNQQSVVGFG